VAIKIGEQTIASRLNDARVAALQAARAYYGCVRALNDFHESAKLLFEDETLRQRRAMLIQLRDDAYRVLKERNQVWDWMRSEAQQHKWDNGERIKD
jgi:hypothetical protein